MSRFTVSFFLAGLLLWSCGEPDFNPAPEALGGLTLPAYQPLDPKQNGEACTAGVECISGNCVDDVCCDSGCGGSCQHCALSGFEGNCRYVPAGQDPDGECPGDPPCGSQCNGSGGCAFAVPGTSCGPCAQCDGNGACSVFQPADSDPADVCGLCRVCPGDGPDCVVVDRGEDPWDECEAEPAESCGQNGNCDGQGGCDLYPPGTICQAELCQDGVHHPADLCDGLGNCIESQTDLCLPYVCLDAVVCRSDCTGDQHCAGGSHCEAPDCVAYLVQGEACSLDAACISDHCVDGFCCDSACNGVCEACDFLQNEGSCLPFADGEDPEDECAGIGLCGGVCDGQRACRFTPDTVKCAACTSCDGAGACALMAQAGSDPFDDCAPCWACSGIDSSCRLVSAGEDGPDDCPDTPESGCGPAGTCDGAGVCQLWPAGTVCQASACADGVLSPADLCDGLGNCIDSGEVDCNGYACLGDEACRTDCLADADCIPDMHCTDGACVADLQDGRACTRDSQCISPNCVDEVCCTSICDGICQRCDLSGSEGTCTLVPAGEDPDGDCSGEGACSGACDTSGACVFPGSETACTPCARCDGSGNCSVWVEINTDPGDACGACRLCPGDGPDCTPVAAGEDTLEECDQQPEDSCGRDGACDGSGACRLWAFGTRCGAQNCIGDTLSRAPACDGAGACIEQGSVSCSPYVCEGIHCAGPAGLHAITIEDAPGGLGSAILDLDLTTDDTLTLYAIGRDESGGFLNDILATWSVDAAVGAILPGPSQSAVFDPATPGTGRILARFNETEISGATGVLTISPGVAAGEIPLGADPRVLPADGASTTTITGGPVTDADSNHVADQTMITLISSAGTLQGNDDNPGLPGLQRAVLGGFFSVELIASDRPARTVVKAVAVPPGTAQGETVVYFSDGRPVADAGEDQTVHAGQQVVLDGSGSWDQQERPLAFAWRQTGGTAVTLAGVDTVAPTFAAPAVTDQEYLTFELTVSAGGEQSGADQTRVNVLGQEAGLPAPVIVLDPAEGAAPLQVLLDGSNSTAVEPAVLTNYLWTFSDDEAPRLGETASRTFAEPGGFGVQLTVTDDQGRFNFAQDQVSVQDGENRPPLLSVSALPERGTVPLEVLFTAQAVDPDGQVMTIEWDFGAGFALQGDQQNKTYHNPGFHKVRVRAKDDGGLYSSLEMTIAASDQGVYPPRILSTPPTGATAGDNYIYAPVAAGTPAFSWSLGKQVGDQLTRAPEGMQVDGVSGMVTWTPKNKQAGPVDVTLVVQNGAGSDFQDFTILVEGGSGEPSCGCGAFYHPGSSQGGAFYRNDLFLVLLIGFLARLRRAGAPRSPARRPPPPAV